MSKKLTALKIFSVNTLATMLLMVGSVAEAQVVKGFSENQVDADDGHAHDLKVDDLVGFKSFDVPSPVHRVFALIRKDGHLINRPFILELRASCEPFSGSNWATLKVGDSESLCGVDPKSLNYDAKTGEITAEYVEPDAEFYKEQIGRKTRNIKQRCLKERKTLRLPLARLCP